MKLNQWGFGSLFWAVSAVVADSDTTSRSWYTYYAKPTAVEDDDFASYYYDDGLYREEDARSSTWPTTGRSETSDIAKTSPAATAVPRSSRSPPTYPPLTLAPTRAAPSPAPTRWCADDPYYRDPINNLVCGDFYDDDCLLGVVFGGMNVDQVADLMAACPYSCSLNHRCEENGTSLRNFDVQSTFRVANTGYLGQTSVEALQQATTTYLTRYMKSQRVRVVFQSALLSSEAIDESIHGGIQLTITLTALAADTSMNANTIQTISEQGLLNTAYARALQITGDASLAQAAISLSSSNGSYNSRNRGRGRGRGRPSPPLPPLLAASSAVLIAATGYFLRVAVEKINKAQAKQPSQDDLNCIIGVEEEYYRNMDADEEAPRSTRRGRSKQRRKSKPRSHSRQSKSIDISRMSTFDSSYHHEDPMQDDCPPDITMVDSNGIIGFLRYDQYNEELGPADSAVTDTSLGMFVERIDGTLEAALAEFHRGDDYEHRTNHNCA